MPHVRKLHPLHPLRPVRGRRAGVATRAAGLVMVMVMAGGASMPAAGQPRLTDGPGTGTSTAAPTGPGVGARQAALSETYQVTLVTGDVVTLHVTPDGRQSAWIDDDDLEHPARVYEQNGYMHVVPAAAEPYLASGVLDPRLFNISLLVEQEYHDAATDELPLVLRAHEGPSTFQDLEPPAGTHAERELPSIEAMSVRADKDRMDDVWESLRGPAPLTATDASSPAQLSGGQTVWLNGKVEAFLDESVPQIGAPQAWEAGYDGTGVTVAVLDSGYDPDHPDLAGRVRLARDFTGNDDEPEPAIDEGGHGTHVAATIAGTGAASDGANVGVAPGADLIIGRVLDEAGSGMEDWIISAMEWAVDEGAQVVNMSLGSDWASDGSDPLSQAVDELTKESGALFVVAAGNTGPRTSSVGSPGAATEALTVGAVDKQDKPAQFSSRGPRWGDGAIKPELVAPGVGIVAARAAGTSLGYLLDEHYTSLNGTSMATPHVAGAAAILAQQHPHWTAKQLKSRLVSTSAPLPDQPVSFQGAGRLDIPAAIGESAYVNEGALSLGDMPDEPGTATHTLTYENPTDRPVRLRLSAELATTGSDGKGKPVVRFGRSMLTVPAGGKASTEVRVFADGKSGGHYSGHIVATDLRQRDAPVRTVTSFDIARPEHQVTIVPVGRDGQLAAAFADLWNLETGESFHASRLDAGEVHVQVPEGRYAVVAVVETEAGVTPGHTIGGDPELTIDGDTRLEYDAREAEPIRVETDRPAVLDRYNIAWSRHVGDRSFTSYLATGWFDGLELSVLPSKRARTGSFELATTWQLVEPQFSAKVSGTEGFTLKPRPWSPDWALAYVGEASLPLVDAGFGTPEELAQADVAGKAVLVKRRGEHELEQQLADVAAAGAELAIAHNDRPGPWRELVWPPPDPLGAYTVDQATGERLRAALEHDPELTLDVHGIRDHTYNYQLVFREQDAIPGGQVYRTADHPIATVVSDYREGSERMARTEMWIPSAGSAVIGNSLPLVRRGPVVRTEYVSADVEWQRLAMPHKFLNVYWTWSDIHDYAAGETYHERWWGPLVRPGVVGISGREKLGAPVARFRDAIRIFLTHYLYDGTVYGSFAGDMGDRSTLTLRYNGELIGKTSDLPEDQFTVPAEEGDVELSLEVINGSEHFADTSVRTETIWAFRSGRADDDGEALPLIQADYELESGQYNNVPAGVSYPLVIESGYQPGASGPGGFEATVEVSYDDGDTWIDAPVAVADGSSGDSSSSAAHGTLVATVPSANGAGFASVRVVLVDADGNELRQQIDRGWRVSAAGG